jgi:hypothetical protein
LVGEFSQEQAFNVASDLASDLGAHSPRETNILLERGDRDERLRAVVAYSHLKVSSVDFEYLKPCCLGDTPLSALLAHAVTQVLRMCQHVDTSPQSEVWSAGRVHGTAAWQFEQPSQNSCEGSGGEDSSGFAAVVQRHSERQRVLHELLVSDGSPEMEEWSSRLTPDDLSDLPESLRTPYEPLAAEWSNLLFQDPHKAIETVWAPLPELPSLPKRPAPHGWLSGIRDEFRSEAASLVDAFQSKLTRWMSGKCERPAPVVLPGLWLQHWLFECPHDFKSEPGWAVPIKLNEPLPSHLNLQFFEEWGRDYPDQEMLSHVILGVRYKADLPTQVVLQPHLQSFLPVQGKFSKAAS